MIVIDANAALYLASADAFGRVVDDLVAPALLWSEVASSVRRGVWHGHVSVELGRATLERVLSSGIRRRAGDDLYRRAIEVASEFAWAKSYDAEYVALGELEQAPLVTLDARLRRRASSLIDVVDPADVLARARPYRPENRWW